MRRDFEWDNWTFEDYMVDNDGFSGWYTNLNTLWGTDYYQTMFSELTLEGDRIADDCFKYILKTIYNYHFNHQSVLAFSGSKYNDEQINNFFLINICSRFDYIFKKYTILDKLYKELTSLNQKSSLKSNTKGTNINAGGNTQRQATTPTAIASSTPASDINISLPEINVNDTDNPTNKNGKAEVAGFANKYTNYQGTSSSVIQGKEVRENTQLREGSTKELLDNIDRLTRSLQDEVLATVAPLFIQVVDEDLMFRRY